MRPAAEATLPNLVPATIAPVRLAPGIPAYEKSAVCSEAPMRMARDMSAPTSEAPIRLAPVRSAPPHDVPHDAAARVCAASVSRMSNSARGRFCPLEGAGGTGPSRALRMFERIRLAPLILAPRRSAVFMFDPLTFAPRRSAPCMLAPRRSAFVMLAPLKSAPRRSAPFMLVPVRSALRKLADRRSAPAKLWPLRF